MFESIRSTYLWEEISYWEDEFGRLQQILLPSEIKKRMEISLNALDKEEKQMFLDIACFLIVQKWDTAIRIWDASGWKGRMRFQYLRGKFLVEVDNGNLIRSGKRHSRGIVTDSSLALDT